MLTRNALALLLLLPAAASAQDLATVETAVVRIAGTRGGTPVRGSGFVIGLDRDKAVILTASHVIEGVQELEVTFAADRTESFPAGVVLGMEAGNPLGLAVFQVRGTLPAGVTLLSFETEGLQRGEEVFLFGFPEMATEPLTLRMSFAGPDGNRLRLDRPTGEGFSGAPVLRKNKVVGVVTGEDLRLSYAVKATVAQDAVIGWGVKLGAQNSTITPTTPAPPALEKCVPGQQSTQNGIVFVRICSGTFIMGSEENETQAFEQEQPAHQVTLSEYWIGMTEITNEQYRRFRPDHQGEGSLPTTRVTWADAKAMCEQIGGRLPTEAEWEYSARAGSQSAWSFGEAETLLGAYAWYGKNSDSTPHPVGTKRANAWGLYDMHGNAYEWVADWFGSYPNRAQADPTGPTSGKARVLRGGSFLVGAKFLRAASRFSDTPEFPGMSFGFRCALSSSKTMATRTYPVGAVAPKSKACVPGMERTKAGISWVRICPGSFTMGSGNADPLGEDNEKPAHQVNLSEFWISKTEITNEQYRRLRPDHKGEDRLPVTSVSWEDAMSACKHFGGRLPTEAQWEYAARAGRQTIWSFGGDEAMLNKYAWYGSYTPQPVGAKKANAWGLHDMHGNVHEWVADWFGAYTSEEKTNPTGPLGPMVSDELGVYRGGSYTDSPWGLRSAFRGVNQRRDRSRNVGFRCVLEPAP